MPFEIGNAIVELRILCGLMFIPHILAKIFARPVTLGFFKAAGFRPPELFMYFGLVVEALASAGLILGYYVPYAAAVAAVFMIVAGVAVLKVSRGQWLWNLGDANIISSGRRSALW